MNTITLRNSFHNTSACVRTDASTPEEAWFNIQFDVYGASHPTKAARSRLHKIEKALCGHDGCQCGTFRP